MNWTNWSGSVTCRPQRIERPASEVELATLVEQANNSNQTIRVVGTGHSFVPLCATDDLLISLDGLQGVIASSRPDLTATVWAGTKIDQLGAPLGQAGLAMENMGDIDRQAIAGAISTGTHGTGRGIGNISTQVLALRLVTATGEIIECSRDVEPDIFKAAQVSLGALGIITQVTLRLLPLYRLHEKSWTLHFQDCLDHLDSLIAENRHFEFFWSPKEDACAVKTLNPTQEPTGVLSPPPNQNTAPPGRLTRYLAAERIDDSYKIFPSERLNRFNEIEFAVPEKDGANCLCEVRELMQTKYPNVTWPIEYRTLGADDIYLSPAYHRDAVTISIHQAHELPYEAFFKDVEAIFRRYRGRPHWGKIHTHTASDLHELYPKWNAFQTVRRRVDPRGLFMNDYLQSLFD